MDGEFLVKHLIRQIDRYCWDENPDYLARIPTEDQQDFLIEDRISLNRDSVGGLAGVVVELRYENRNRRPKFPRPNSLDRQKQPQRTIIFRSRVDSG